MKLCCLIVVACATLAGCVTPLADFTNPYNLLLPAGFQIRESPVVVERARLPQQKVAVVIGPNFEAGVAKFQEIRQFTVKMNALQSAMGQASSAGLGRLTAGYSGPIPFDDMLKGKFDVAAPGKGGDAVLESGSTPEKTAGQIADFLGKLFGRAEFFPDLASARDARPDFIVVFDEGYIRHSMTDWSRVGVLDLFTPNLERVAAGSFNLRPKAPDIGFMDSKAVSDRKLIEWNANNDRTFMRGLLGDFMTKIAQRSR